MKNLLPCQVQYLNTVNAILRAAFGRTFQDLGITADKVVKSEKEGWTPKQFCEWVVITIDGLTPAGV